MVSSHRVQIVAQPDGAEQQVDFSVAINITCTQRFIL
jgi:hypothetical protein